MDEGLHEKNRVFSLLILFPVNYEPLPGDPQGEGEWLLSNEEGGRDNREASVELSLSQHYPFISAVRMIIYPTN